MKPAAGPQFNRPPSVIEVRPSPTPTVGEVLGRIEASRLSRTRDHAAHGEWPVKPTLPFVPGGGPRANLLLLGPPASGKGTQADILTERLDIPPIATGNILRAELAQRTELGLRAQAYMQRGDLVPDALMIDIIRERLRRSDRLEGFLLDGFPRTLPQARALDALAASIGIGFDRVLYLNVPEPELIRRITSRLTCSVCGRSYFFEPDQPRVRSCEVDGMDLIVREDDRAETAQRRIAVYLQDTLPVLDHYREQGLVAEVDGIGSVEEISQRMLRALPDLPGARSPVGMWWPRRPEMDVVGAAAPWPPVGQPPESRPISR
jgi:adenylate kinase